MKKLLVVTLVTAGLIAGMGLNTKTYASDWDKAGKVLVVTEGLRIITGGAVDILGTVTGTKQRVEARTRAQDRDERYCGYGPRDDRDGPRYARRFDSVERVWVPHYVIRERYIPAHGEYRPGYGQVWVSGYYEQYEVQEGGHWEEMRVCRR
jgi:hypothetical protein